MSQGGGGKLTSLRNCLRFGKQPLRNRARHLGSSAHLKATARFTSTRQTRSVGTQLPPDSPGQSYSAPGRSQQGCGTGCRKPRPHTEMKPELLHPARGWVRTPGTATLTDRVQPQTESNHTPPLGWEAPGSHGTSKAPSPDTRRQEAHPPSDS